MKTLLIGAGAIGSCVAVLAKESGIDIDILCIDKPTAELLSTKGITVTGAKGNHHAVFKTYASMDDFEYKYDICFIATKAFSMPALAGKVVPYMNENFLLVSMQNGISTEKMAETVGAEHTVGCVIGYGATFHSYENVEMTSAGEFFIGMLDGRSDPKLPHVKKILDCLLPTTVCDNIIARQYSKLIINSCINALAAIAGQTLGTLLDDRRARDIFLGIAREAIKVAVGMGLNVPPYNGILNFKLLLVSNSALFNGICKAIFRSMGKRKYADVRPSTLQSIDRGEPTEIDYFNGYIVGKGVKYNVPTPVNSLCVKLVKEIEKGERKCSLDNLDEFATVMKLKK